MKRLLGIILIICLLLGLLVLEQAYSTPQTPGSTVTDAPVEYKPQVNDDYKNYSREFYRIFRDDCVKTITVVITEQEWESISSDMLAYSRIDGSMRTANYRRANLIYEDRDGKVTLNDIGIRTRGNTTRILPQYEDVFYRAHFKLKFNETFSYPEESEEYQELATRSFMSLEALNLKANMYNDPSYIHEKYAYELIAKSGALAPKVSLVQLKMKIGEKEIDYGVYSMIEPIDEKFLEKRVDNPNGNLYKCLWQNYGPATLERITDKAAIGIKDWRRNYRPAYDLKTNKKKADHTVLLEFINNLNSLYGEELEKYLEANFEVDNFLKYMACNGLLGMPDDYIGMGNNYYLYFNPRGKVEFIPYDYDQCLGSGWTGEHPQGHEGIANADILTWQNTAHILSRTPSSRPLADAILSVDKYKNQYLEYLDEYIDPDNKMFSYAVFKGMFDSLSTMYQPYTLNDTVDGREMQLTNEEWYFTTRINSVKDQRDGSSD